MVVLLLYTFLIQCGKSEASGKLPLVQDGKWISLFNGENLDNWMVKIRGHQLGENWKETFKADNGVIKVDYSEYDSFDGAYGHLFYKTPFSNYRLKLKYRFTGEQVRGGERWALKNSGVMIHCQPPETMELDQDFPVSIEVQLLGGIDKGDERSTANVCTPGTHINFEGRLLTDHCLNSESDTFYGDQWVDLEVVVRNDSVISHFVNGKKVIEYTRPIYGGEYNTRPELKGQALEAGYISLQSESHPVEFKDVKLLPIN